MTKSLQSSRGTRSIAKAASGLAGAALIATMAVTSAQAADADDVGAAAVWEGSVLCSSGFFSLESWTEGRTTHEIKGRTYDKGSQNGRSVTLTRDSGQISYAVTSTRISNVNRYCNWIK